MIEIIVQDSRKEISMAAFIVEDSKTSISDVARKLIKDGLPEEDLLFVFRNGTLCFNPIPLKDWASVTLRENDREFKYYKYVPFDASIFKKGEQLDGKEAVSN